jgi:hypothetical protein
MIQVGLLTGPGISLPGPDRTGPGSGLGHQHRYPDRVFAFLLVPGPDLMYPDRTKCTYIWELCLKIFENVTQFAHTTINNSTLTYQSHWGRVFQVWTGPDRVWVWVGPGISWPVPGPVLVLNRQSPDRTGPITTLICVQLRNAKPGKSSPKKK